MKPAAGSSPVTGPTSPHELRMRFAEPGPTSEVVLEAELVGAATHRVYFRSDDTPLAPAGEILVTVGLLPAMKTARTLVSECALSQRFVGAVDDIVQIYTIWEPQLRAVPIEGLCPEPRPGTGAERVGTFFSGGVDSFYTLIKHRQEITDVIFVHGFDIRLDDHALRAKASAAIREVGANLGKHVIEIETNLRTLLDAYVPWARLSHGSALATIGHLLGRSFRRIYVPATHTYADLFPWGSHPLLDHRWSTESLEFVHDGCEATRVGKVALLAQSEVALRTLRVCWRNPNGVYNCGRCEKCVRTMINLHAVGALERCSSFGGHLDLRDVTSILVLDDNTRAFVQENLRALHERDGDEALRRALTKILERPRWRALLMKSLRRHRMRKANRLTATIGRLGHGWESLTKRS